MMQLKRPELTTDEHAVGEVNLRPRPENNRTATERPPARVDFTPKTFKPVFLVANVVHARFRIARDPTTAAAIADPYLGQSIGPVPGYGVS